MSNIEDRLKRKGLITDKSADILKSIDSKLLEKEKTECEKMKKEYELFILHGNL